jgi:hypothetical protein
MSNDAFYWWQPRYAEHGIATFPVNAREKVPLIRNFGQVGLRASAALAKTHGEANGLGFCPGKRSSITVLDVDTPDEKVLADALDRHGATPVIIRTGGGKFHAWYRHNGEHHAIRPDKTRPIDILGGGLVIAPFSAGRKRYYEFIQGSPDDIPSLPVMQALVAANDATPGKLPPLREGEGRNNLLFDQAREIALRAATKGELVEMLRQDNQQLAEPVGLDEIHKIAGSVWTYKENARLLVKGSKVVMMPHAIIDDLKGAQNEQDAFYLLILLNRHHWGRNFYIANAMASSLGWGLPRFKAAVRRLVHGGYIRCVSPARGRSAPSYAFGSSSRVCQPAYQ